MYEKCTGTSNWRSQISITALCRIFVCFRSHSSALCGSHPRYARGQKSLIHNCRELPPITPEWRASRASLEAPINPLLLCGELCARPVESEFSGCLREQGRTPECVRLEVTSATPLSHRSTRQASPILARASRVNRLWLVFIAVIQARSFLKNSAASKEQFL